MPYIALDPANAAAAPVIPHGAPRKNSGETLGSMRAELGLMLGNRADATQPRLDRWINQGYIDLWMSLRLEESFGSYSFETLEDQPVYTLPEQVVTTIGVAMADKTDSLRGGHPLKKTDLFAYRRMRVAEGIPEFFFRSDELLVLYPTPDGTRELILDFRMRPLHLTVEDDSPILDFEWHETILLNARKKAFSGLMEFDKAMSAENDYIQSVRRRRDPDAEEQEGRIVQSSAPHHEGMLSYRPFRRKYY